jgi:hypothetical protein
MGQCKITAFIGIATASLCMALEAVCPNRLMDRADCLIHGNCHICRVGNKNTPRFYPFVLYLVTDETIDVFELGL